VQGEKGKKGRKQAGSMAVDGASKVKEKVILRDAAMVGGGMQKRDPGARQSTFSKDLCGFRTETDSTGGRG